MLSGWLVTFLAVLYLGTLFAIARYGDARADAGRSIISANVCLVAGRLLHLLDLFWQCRPGHLGRAVLPDHLSRADPDASVCWRSGQDAAHRQGAAHHQHCRFHRCPLWQECLVGRPGDGDRGHRCGALHRLAVESGGGQSRSSGRSAWSGVRLAGIDSTLLVAAVLAAFTILFGTRHLDATERHEGMVAAVAFESLVKLLAFLAVGLFVTYGMYDGFSDISRGRQLIRSCARCWRLIRRKPVPGWR